MISGQSEQIEPILLFYSQSARWVNVIRISTIDILEYIEAVYIGFQFSMHDVANKTN